MSARLSGKIKNEKRPSKKRTGPQSRGGFSDELTERIIKAPAAAANERTNERTSSPFYVSSRCITPSPTTPPVARIPFLLLPLLHRHRIRPPRRRPSHRPRFNPANLYIRVFLVPGPRLVLAAHARGVKLRNASRNEIYRHRPRRRHPPPPPPSIRSPRNHRPAMVY